MNIHTVFNHLVGRDCFSTIFRVWFTCVRQVISRIYLLCCHCRVGWINNGINVVNSLQNTLCVFLVRLLFYVLKVLSLILLVVQARFMRMKNDVIIFYTIWNICFFTEIDGLWNMLQVFDVSTFL